MLQYAVIAGPNGAGKSTLSARLSKNNAIIFDPDIAKFKIEKQYPDISDDAVQAAVTRAYYDTELRALGGQKHLTVETNLKNEFLGERALAFKESGYRTCLIFMMLPDVLSSMARVNQRVYQKGHFVDAENIKQNFRYSLENLVKVASNFDEVMLVCAASEYGIISTPEPLLIVRDGVVILTNENTPDWARSVVENVVGVLAGRGRDTSTGLHR